MLIDHAVVETPVGPLDLYAREGTLCGLAFPGSSAGVRQFLERRFGPVALRAVPDPFGFVSQIGAYFAGELEAIDRLAVDTGGTDFQQRAWAALRQIPRGETIPYAELARRVGAPRAVRAVGLANGQNPLCIVVPCHRVIASDGTLCGYGGGQGRKRWLLRHEGATWAEKARRPGRPQPDQLTFSVA